MEKGEWKIAEGKPSGGFPLHLWVGIYGDLDEAEKGESSRRACRALRAVLRVLPNQTGKVAVIAMPKTASVGQGLAPAVFLHVWRELKNGTLA